MSDALNATGRPILYSLCNVRIIGRETSYSKHCSGVTRYGSALETCLVPPDHFIVSIDKKSGIQVSFILSDRVDLK